MTFTDQQRATALRRAGTLPERWRPIPSTIVDVPAAPGSLDLLRALSDHTEREIAELRAARAEHLQHARKITARMGNLVRAARATEEAA